MLATRFLRCVPWLLLISVLQCLIASRRSDAQSPGASPTPGFDTVAFTRLSYERLAEMQNDEAVVKALHLVLKNIPDMFLDPQLTALVATAALNSKEPPNAVDAKRIVAARRELKGRGTLAILKRPGLRAAVITVMWKARLMHKFQPFAHEAGAYFKEAREAALARMCIANLKVLSGAIEMYVLDKNSFPDWPNPAQWTSALMTGKYITNKVETCPLDGQRLTVTRQGTEYEVACPTHGTPKAPRSPPAVPDRDILAASNPCVWAVVQLTKQSLTSSPLSPTVQHTGGENRGPRPADPQRRNATGLEPGSTEHRRVAPSVPDVQ